MNRIYQQGDVVLMQRDKLPKGLKKIKPKGARVVLAEGEATGHSHDMPTAVVDLYETDEKTRWIDVKEAAPVTHQEHDTQVVVPGIYETWIVREVDPFNDEIRKVQD
jgi:hypothetical protein